MLIGLWVLRKGFTGLSRKWWTVALVIQFWHHIEHLLLIGQATFHQGLMGKPVPFSVLQFFFRAWSFTSFTMPLYSFPW